MAEEDLDLVVHLGDYIYESSGAPIQTRAVFVVESGKPGAVRSS